MSFVVKRKVIVSVIKKKCSADEDEVCDFCIHFNMFKDKDGGNIDGSGYCGLKRKVVDAGDGCKNYYCFTMWKRNMKRVGRGK